MIDWAMFALALSARQMRRLYSIFLSRSPLALYASAALLSAMMLVESTARISLETLMMESGGALPRLNAVNRHSRPSVELGYAAIAARPSATAASYFCARRSFSHVLYAGSDLRASPKAFSTG